MSIHDDTEAIKSLVESYDRLIASDRTFSAYTVDNVMKAINALAGRIEAEAKRELT